MVDQQTELFELKKPVIKGYPELRWTGKRPYNSTQFFPAQMKEKYGTPNKNNWMNKIFWGDNLQVMSHLLKEYRGKVDLIYIDPPFDSKADYKKKIKLKGKEIESNSSTFEEKQYGDIWSNDEYLQFMYERLLLMRELLSETGSIYLHCDWHRSAFLRMLLDEVFGPTSFRNEIVWSYFGFKRATSKKFPQKHDIIYSYTKTANYTWNVQYKPHSEEYIKRFKKDPISGRLYRDDVNPTGGGTRIIYLDEVEGDIIDSVWDDIPPVNPVAKERQDYPTQKPEKLLERIIQASTNEGDLVFDCFMGSGTTQAVAQKLGRRFIGADINLGAVQTTTKRLINIIEENNSNLLIDNNVGFEVYNVNNYDFFRNPLEARDLLIEAFNIQAYSETNVFDGELDGRKVKILPVNRIATKADLNELVANLPYSQYEKIKENDPLETVEKIVLICMGHEPDLKGTFLQMIGNYNMDVEIVDVLKDKTELEFKRDAQANIQLIEGNKLEIQEFYPMNLLQKLSIQKEEVDNWKQLVDSILIDYNYDGEVLNPQIIDVPEKNELVKGAYEIPDKHGRIMVKITDLLSESFEEEI